MSLHQCEMEGKPTFSSHLCLARVLGPAEKYAAHMIAPVLWLVAGLQNNFVKSTSFFI